MDEIIHNEHLIEKEEIQLILRLKAEEIIASEDEKLLAQILRELPQLSVLINEILGEDDPPHPNALAGIEDKGVFHHRVMAGLHAELGDERFDLGERLHKLSRDIMHFSGRLDSFKLKTWNLFYSSNNVVTLLESIERKEIRLIPLLSRIFQRKGRNVILAVIKLDKDQRKDVRRKAVGLKHTEDMIDFNTRKISSIAIYISGAERIFRGLHPSLRPRDYSNPSQEYVDSQIEQIRWQLASVLPMIEEVLTNLRNAIEWIDNFKHWLTHAIHEDERALKIQKQLDQMIVAK